MKAPPIAPPPKPAQPQPVAGPQQHRPVGKHYNRPRPQQAGAIVQQAVDTTDTEVDSHYCYNMTMETKVLHFACPKFPAGKVFRQISTLLENDSPIFRQREMLSLPRFGHFPARKTAAGKLAAPAGTLLDFLLRDRHSLLEFF